MYSLPGQEVSSTSSREDVFCIMAGAPGKMIDQLDQPCDANSMVGVRSNYADVKPQDSMTTVTSNYIIDFCISCPQIAGCGPNSSGEAPKG
jgi:hypothetical protein